MIFARDTILIAMMLGAMALAGPLAALAMAPPPSGNGPVLIFAADAVQVVHMADGHEVALAGNRWMTLAQGGEGFVERASAHGAWRVMDGRWLAQICSVFEGYQG